MIGIRYFGIEACKSYGFPYIYNELTSAEQAPIYESEPVGLAELEKVLTFVQYDFYPTFADKCAYIICSIAGSQYFTNGNKRLGITVLLMFLIRNEAEVTDKTEDELRRLLAKYFPLHIWESDLPTTVPHSLFLYNLAIAVGDRRTWETSDFSHVRDSVSIMFRELYSMGK